MSLVLVMVAVVLVLRVRTSCSVLQPVAIVMCIHDNTILCCSANIYSI